MVGAFWLAFSPRCARQIYGVLRTHRDRQALSEPQKTKLQVINFSQVVHLSCFGKLRITQHLSGVRSPWPACLSSQHFFSCFFLITQMHAQMH